MNKNANIECVFSKSYNISYNDDYFCCVGLGANLYNKSNGESVIRFKGIPKPACSGFTSDKLVVKGEGKHYIYDLKSMELEKVIPLPRKDHGSITDFALTSDGRYIIDSSCVDFPTNRIRIIDIKTGENTFIDADLSGSIKILETENDSVFYIVRCCLEDYGTARVIKREFFELIYDSGKFELKKMFERNGDAGCVTYCGGRFALEDYNKITVIDIQNNVVNEFCCDEFLLHLCDLKLSSDGRYAALAQSKKISIYDMVEKKWVKSYDVEYGCFVDFFDEDKLLIGTWQKGYCVRWK